MRLADGQTDRQTDGQTELRQQYPALHYMPHGKKPKVTHDKVIESIHQ